MAISKEDLEEIKKELLAQKLEILREGGKTIEDGGLTQAVDDLSDFADLSSSESDRDFLLRLRDRDRKLLNKIDLALENIEKNTFGICGQCGNEINIKRLKARPVVTLCINCKNEQEKEEKKFS
ncbi:MAG: TraR/DksA family transcriptional regulator [bacterium]